MSLNIRQLLTGLLFILLPACLLAQDISPARAELEKKRNQLQQDIQRATLDLNDVQQNRRETMTQLQLLQNKIRLRNKLIDNINEEINYINGDINAANRDIKALQKDLDTLRAQYAKLIVYAYKNHNAYDFLNFILSANSFNDAIKRFQYLKQYREYRKHQASSILETQAQLKQKVDKLAAIKEKRSGALGTEEKQRHQLEEEKQQKNEMVQSFRGHEKELLAEINKKKKETRQLSSRIAAVIRQEIEEARRKAAEEAAARARAEAEARARAEAVARSVGLPVSDSNAVAGAPRVTASPGEAEPSGSKAARPENVLEDTPEAMALSENFEANKGKLPWPVTKAIVLEPFGIHQHPALEHVMMENDGITLRTNAGSEVRSIFDGEVVSVFPLSGKWNVMIKHGQYFTAYANLRSVSVKKGDKVKTLQTIGIVYSNAAGEAELELQIYKGSTPVNPENWLQGR